LHQTPMNAGKKGGFYCPKKMPDGSYCQQRIAAAPVAAPQVAVPVATEYVPPPSLPTPIPYKIMMAQAALMFAAQVYHGSGPTGEEGALVLAQRAYGWLWNAEDQSVPNF